MSTAPLLDASSVRNAFATSYIEAAAMTALLYDHVLTLAEEIELIWKSSFSIVKLLFLVNRYSVLGVMLVQTWSMAGFAGGLDDHFCRSLFFAVSAWQLIAGGGISPFLLFLRVWSIYGRTKEVQIIVGGLCIANFVAITIAACINIWPLLDNIFYASEVNRCICTAHPRWMWTLWVAPLLYEIVIFGMIAYKTWTHMREDIHTPIITTLWRDGILYFTVLVAVRIYTILAWIVAPPSLFFMAIYLMLATITTMASRTILHLRAAARHRDSGFYPPPDWTFDEPIPPISDWLGLRVLTWVDGMNGEQLPMSPLSPGSASFSGSPVSPASPGSPRHHANERQSGERSARRTPVKMEHVSVLQETEIVTD